MKTFFIIICLLSPCFLRAEEKGFWLNSPGMTHSIQYPKGWPFPGASQSISPSGMKHLFFLVSPDKLIGLDIAAPTSESLEPYEWAEFVRTMRVKGGPLTPPVMEKKPLEKSAVFTCFKSVEAGPGGKNYFLQGVLEKAGEKYYITITSPRRHPSPKDWKEIRSALLSLRRGSSTAGGVRTPAVDAAYGVKTKAPVK